MEGAVEGWYDHPPFLPISPTPSPFFDIPVTSVVGIVTASSIHKKFETHHKQNHINALFSFCMNVHTH